MNKRKWLEYGGIASGVILIAFGIGAVGDEHQRLQDGQRQPQGGEDHERGDGGHEPGQDRRGCEGRQGFPPRSSCRPAASRARTSTPRPEARCFAEYMRIHALESTGGLTYSELGRYASEDGDPKGTNDFAAAATDDAGKPLVEPRAEHLGHRDRVVDRAERLLHGLQPGALRSRRRDRAVAQRDRLHHPRDSRARPRGPSRGPKEASASRRRRHELSSPPETSHGHGRGGAAAPSSFAVDTRRCRLVDARRSALYPARGAQELRNPAQIGVAEGGVGRHHGSRPNAGGAPQPPHVRGDRRLLDARRASAPVPSRSSRRSPRTGGRRGSRRSRRSWRRRAPRRAAAPPSPSARPWPGTMPSPRTPRSASPAAAAALRPGSSTACRSGTRRDPRSATR